MPHGSEPPIRPVREVTPSLVHRQTNDFHLMKHTDGRNGVCFLEASDETHPTGGWRLFLPLQRTIVLIVVVVVVVVVLSLLSLCMHEPQENSMQCGGVKTVVWVV